MATPQKHNETNHAVRIRNRGGNIFWQLCTSAGWLRFLIHPGYLTIRKSFHSVFRSHPFTWGRELLVNLLLSIQFWPLSFFYIFQNFTQSFLFTSNFNTWLLSNHLADSPLFNKLFQGALFKVDGWLKSEQLREGLESNIKLLTAINVRGADKWTQCWWIISVS